MRFAVQFADVWLDFRLPEVLSLLERNNVPIASINFDSLSKTNTLWDTELPSVDVAVAIAQKAILIKRLHRMLCRGTSLEAVLAQCAKELPEALSELPQGFRYSLKVAATGMRETVALQRKVIEMFVTDVRLPFQQHGIVDLKNPQYTFKVHIVHDPATEEVKDVWLLLTLCEGNRSGLSALALNKRPYLGTTSMDPELCMLMVNQAVLTPGSLAMDPFVGTASILIPMAKEGAFSFGFEIDPRIVRGCGRSLATNKPGTSIQSNFEMFKIMHITDAIIGDSSRLKFRQGPFLDAIVTDPPYGIREGAKKLARRPDDCRKPDPTKNYQFISTCKENYDAVDLLKDLLNLAANRLVVGGRLVYFLAVFKATFDESDFPTHPALCLLSASEQEFGKWSRYLITMRKIREPTDDETTTVERVERGEVPSFVDFRDMYFASSEQGKEAVFDSTIRNDDERKTRMINAYASSSPLSSK